MDFKELIEMIMKNAAAQEEQTKKMERWTMEMGWAPPKTQEREPTELERLLQEWEQASTAPQSPEPEGEEPPLPEPRGEEPPLPEPRGEEPPLPEPRGEEPPLPEPRGEELPLPEPRGEEVKGIPPPPPRPPPLRSSPAQLHAVPCPSLLDTLSVGLDLPALDLEPRSRQKRTKFSTSFPAPLLPDTKTSLYCS
ncbi:arp2/3 complex-activating protein rickA-like [Acipenser ruthenus]|uniref:arp2/3 complex-activating protein rickA-like n=1 Tax=Acipenser ruthenus TaxID=7906 RepID=UPI00274232C9|nr:arp2/3 complex-activating protein rickA-like [Acipenser ruthenus]